MTQKNLTCISCPLGCYLTIEMDGNNIVAVSGNTCKRGDIYARKELIRPTRIVTTTVPVVGGSSKVVSVKTKEDIPKEKIGECLAQLKKVVVTAPVFIGDIIVANVADTEIAIVATKSVDKKRYKVRREEKYGG